MDNIRQVIEQKRCVGCGACRNICPTGAISLELNKEGFYQPNLSTEKCIQCSLCDKVCPVGNVQYINSQTPECYALMAADDIRARSSSGGAFELLADIVFEQGGYVCGVAYRDGCTRTEHIIIESKDDLYKLQGSKYLQSDTNDVYARIKALLQKGKRVLFSGCPCQVAGLYGYLGELKNTENLLTVDLICHGIPSLKAFDHYVRDIHGGKEISRLGFKDKEYGWHASMTIDFQEGDRFNQSCETDYFFKSYLNGLNKNAPCGNCIFARIPRQGDITIGDYWGINNYNPAYNDGKGTSVVLLNNEKALALKQLLKKAAKLFEKTPLEGAVKGNSNLVSSPSVKISRSQFFKNLDDRHYPELVNWAFAADRFDVGIVGIPIFPNFGGALTYYGLYRALRDMGYTVALFSRPRSTGKPPIPPEKVYAINPYEPKALHLDYKDKQAMATACDWCDAFVVGSDQLFNADLYRTFGEIVTLDWVSDNHRKVAYAASFGHSYFWGPEKQRAQMAHYMKKFDAFSVREEEGVALAKHTFGIDATWVLDPVFLCDKKHYISLAEQSRKKDKTPHIFAYILDPDAKKNTILRHCAQKLKLPVEQYSEMLYDPTPKQIEEEKKRFVFDLQQGNINDRLYSLIHSDFVIADSFHGICFAIIFNIPFIAILNRKRGASRFYTILSKLGLLDRLVTSFDEVKDSPALLQKIDFSGANILLQKEKEQCLSWLRNAVSPKEECKKAFSTEDILKEKLEQVNRSLLQKDIRMNALINGRGFFLISDLAQYFSKIEQYQDELVVAISVKDTPGYSFNESHASAFRRLGLQQSLVGKHWHSYVAVLDGKSIVSEVLSKKDERVAYVGSIGGKAYKVVSISFNRGNVSAVFIDGVDFSENRRGLNIVLYDKRLGAVIDTVNFDTHDPKIPCYRFGMRSAVNIINNIEKGKEVAAAAAPAVPVAPSKPLPAALPGKQNELLEGSESLLHGSYYAAGFGGSFVDYFIDRGIKRIAVYGTDLLIGLLYEQAYAKGIEVVGLYSDCDRDASIRFPKVGKIHLKDIRSVDLSAIHVPIVVAAAGYPLELAKYKRNGGEVYKIGELNYYSIVKNSLFDPVLKYASDVPDLKLCVLNMTRAYEVKNPSELEKSIILGKRNAAQIFQAIYYERGFDKEYVDNIIKTMNIVHRGGVDFIADETSLYRKCSNGYRTTTKVPSAFLNTVYVFGNSVAFGVGTDDEHTIESTLQSCLNEYYKQNSPYAVLNCANGGGVNTQAQWKSFKFHAPSSGDIVVLCMGFGDLLQNVYQDKFLWVDTAQLFARPHDLGEIYYDNDHMNCFGYEACGKELARRLIESGLPGREILQKYSSKNQEKPKIDLEGDLTPAEEEELNKYLSEIQQYRRDTNGRIGSIVMNCNPFTLGHRYLIETSAAKCDVLYIFVVEEDRSMFPFKDRIELVRKGTADLKNVVVLPSGKFIISQTTFQAYFTKEEKSDVVIDASNDINIFASKIAPSLDITVRFAGEEPLDNVTNQYNATMMRLLPRAGIDFEVIKRREEGGAPISASRVRALLKEKNFDEIARITPPTTYEYLLNRFKDSKNVLVLGGTRFMGIRLVEKLIEKNHFVTIATRGIHLDPFGKHVTRVKIDRLKEDTMRTAFEGKYYDIVFDTTAYCSNAVKYALTHIKCGRYIQVSSVAIYGTKEVLKREEQFDPNTAKFELCDSMENYGIGKRYAECTACQLFPNISKAIVRVPFVVEEENLDNKELNLRLFFYARHIVKDIPMMLDNLDLTCSFIRTTEEADFLIQLACSNYSGVVNLSSQGTVTIGEIVNYLENKSGHKVISDQNGDVHPFNKQHFKVGVAFDLMKAKSIGYNPPLLKDWLWPLLDSYIKMLEGK